ncbi:MAG: glutathione peroxidase [Sterolibacterium sp.]|jgi:glutathione peroxidase|nr:glutathione peroxidase [Sterolibacterium sp.]
MTPTTALYTLPLHTLAGQATTLATYQGQVLLIVNVASQCGLTLQYAGLEKLHETYGARGLSVLGFPCNDFLGQEPGSAGEIQAFCETQYGVRFPLFEKLRINSAPRHPLYAYLINAQPQAINGDHSDGGLRERLAQKNLLPPQESDVTWNFEKFLVSRDGQVLARYAPDVTPADPRLIAAIEAALQ